MVVCFFEGRTDVGALRQWIENAIVQQQNMTEVLTVARQKAAAGRSA
jgi:hypothetical protein